MILNKNKLILNFLFKDKRKEDKMKSFNFFKKIICLAVVMATLLLSVASCGGLGKPLLKLEDASLSVNLFELYLSRTKGTLCSADYFGPTAKDSGFWETWIDVYEKKTYNTHYTELVLDNAKSYLAAVAEFDKLGLKLPQSYIDEIDTKLQEMIDNDANGSKTAFNAILAEYGANYEILREAYIIEAKIAYLREELFGKNGSKIGANIIDDYYKENYVRFKQIFLYSYELVYDEDANGDKIYYRTDNSKVSYDTSKTAKVNADGKYAVDENGDRVYVYTDENGKERIAYKKDGAAPKQKFDADGNAIVRYYEKDSEEMKILNSDAKAIMEEAKTGDFAGFDLLVEEYNQEDGSKDYPNGYYVSQNTAYEAGEVIDELFKMQVGEVKQIPSDYGIHIVMRYELEDGAYTFEENEDLFISIKTGTYVFMSHLMDELLADYLKDSKEKITVDEALLKTVDIKSAGINFYY